MRRIPLALSIASLLVAIVIFLLADPPRSIYSGLLFVVIGVVLFLNARRST